MQRDMLLNVAFIEELELEASYQPCNVGIAYLLYGQWTECYIHGMKPC
jgi:hypothetical protein